LGFGRGPLGGLKNFLKGFYTKSLGGPQRGGRPPRWRENPGGAIFLGKPPRGPFGKRNCGDKGEFLGRVITTGTAFFTPLSGAREKSLS